MSHPAFPSEVLAPLGDIYSITTPKQGATSQVWVVECAAGMRVVKYSAEMPFRAWLWHEANVLRALANTDLPIPEVYFNGQELAQPLPYLVMSRLAGEPLSIVMSQETATQKRLDWMARFGAALRRIHDTPTLPELVPSRPWLDERMDTAASYIQAGFELDADDPPRLLEHLRANRPEPVRPTLIHGDFMWDNMLVEGDQISGIVDWGGGAYGDPRYDLALAILPHEDGDLSPAEVAAFYTGYGCEPLSNAEYRYFINLYGFF